jgi:hypothetical protein
MHLLTITSTKLDEMVEPVDLGQSPGDILVLSFADSDLSALAAAWEKERESLPSVRLAQLRDLRHPMSIDLWIERVATHAKVIVVRLLGGLDWWRYGVERLAGLARERAIALAFLPGEDREDARLAEASTLAADELYALLRFFRAGGQDNMRALLRRLAGFVARRSGNIPPPERGRSTPERSEGSRVGVSNAAYGPPPGSLREPTSPFQGEVTSTTAVPYAINPPFGEGIKADAFDRRIVTLLAFGPAASVIALSAISGRGTIAMWGYPLWLFLGVWMLLEAPQTIAARRVARALVAWAGVFSIFALAFIANYTVLPAFDHRYRAAFYPGERLAEEIALRFRVATGAPLRYVIASMWDGGNVGHYAREHPRVLIDGDPRRAPWIDLGDLRSKGAVVLWTDADPGVIPMRLRGLADDAQVQPPFTIPFRRGDHVLTVGWAILRPAPAFASLTLSCPQTDRQWARTTAVPCGTR